MERYPLHITHRCQCQAHVRARQKGDSKRDGNRTRSAHFRRFCRFSLIFGSLCRNQEIWESQICAENRRLFAGNRRKPQIFAETGFSHLLSPFWRAPIMDIQFEPLIGEIEVKMKESVRDTRLDQKETHRIKFQRSVVEIDCFDLELHTQHGTWAIPIRITDFSYAQGWQGVSVGDVCGRVNESYGYLWGSGRLSIAFRRRVLREEQTVAETLREVTAFQLVPPDQYGAKRSRSTRRKKINPTPPRPPRSPSASREQQKDIQTSGQLLNFERHTDRKLMDPAGWATFAVFARGKKRRNC